MILSYIRTFFLCLRWHFFLPNLFGPYLAIYRTNFDDLATDRKLRLGAFQRPGVGKPKQKYALGGGDLGYPVLTQHSHISRYTEPFSMIPGWFES